MDKKSLLKNIYLLLGPKIFLIFILSFFASFSESVGIMMFLPVLESISSDGSGNQSFILALIHELLGYLSIEINIKNFLIIIAFCFLVKGILTFFSLAFVAYLRGQLFSELRLSLLKAFSSGHYELVAEQPSGFYANAINEQTTRGIQSFYFFTQAICQLLSSLMYFSVAFFLAWKFGLTAIVVAFLVFIGFRYLNQIVYKQSKTSNVASIELTNSVVEGMRNFMYLAATANTGYLIKYVKVTIEKARSIQTKFWLFSSFTQSVREPLAVFFIISIVAIQVTYFNQNINPILVAIVLFYRGLNAVIMTQTFWQNSLEFVNGLEIIFSENLRLKNITNLSENKSVSKINIKDISTIELNDVTYKKNSMTILDGVNIHIKAKSIIGLIGSSGSGKSTLINLITGVFSPTAGSVLINGINLEMIDLRSWQKQIGYVTQDANLFNKSFYENISLSRNLTLTQKRMCEEMAKAVGLFDFIVSNELAFDRYIGEGGSNLSGGQRQRLALARELYKNPKVLILDEATSALDKRTEEYVLKKIISLKKDTTILFISHDPSHLPMFDDCYNLELNKSIGLGYAERNKS